MSARTRSSSFAAAPSRARFSETDTVVAMKAPLLGLVAFTALAILVLLSMIDVGAGVFLAIIEAVSPLSG
jgi:uncharacterized membrane protein